ncbi:hypothetical protein ACHQM5_007929 [Ranunculus cassubicifolius]
MKSSCLLFLFFSIFILFFSAFAIVRVELPKKEDHRAWQRKPWMNHGSFRGHRKHLINPTQDHHFQISKSMI